MPVYEYEAISKDGRSVSGLLNADSPADARAQLRDRKLFATSVRQALKAGGRGLGAEILKALARRGRREVGPVIQQLAVLLEVGVPLREALTTLIDQVRSRQLEAALRDVREKVAAGGSLADALGDHPYCFDDLLVNMVAAGESSGELAAVLARYSDHVLERDELTAQVKAALTYPIIMLTVGTLTVGFLIGYVVPRVSRMLTEAGQQLPLPTRILVAAGEAVKGYGLLGLFCLLGLAVAYRVLIRRPSVRFRRDRLLLSVPLLGPVMTKSAVARFTSTLALLLRSGLPLHEGLAVVARVLNNAVLANAVDQVRAGILSGSGMGEPMRRQAVFPPTVAQAISVGEESGELPQLLDRLSQVYDKEVARALRRLGALVEPAVILVMGLVVLFVVLSVLQPIMRISSLEAL